MSKVLFISYTGLLVGLTDSRIRPETLDQGLFYFGCSRQAFLYGVIPCGPSLKEIYEASLAYLKLETAVLEAEPRHRVVWRPEDGNPSYQQLNQLLVKNGLAPLKTEGEYAYPGVRKKMAKSNPEIEVFY
jgi:hypothetical protein